MLRKPTLNAKGGRIPCPCGRGCGLDVDGNSLRHPAVHAQLTRIVQGK